MLKKIILILSICLISKDSLTARISGINTTWIHISNNTNEPVTVSLYTSKDKKDKRVAGYKVEPFNVRFIEIFNNRAVSEILAINKSLKNKSLKTDEIVKTRAFEINPESQSNHKKFNLIELSEEEAKKRALL